MKEGWVYKSAGEVFTITDFVSNGSFASLRENVKYLDHPDYAVLIRLADYSNGFDKNKFVYVSKQSYEYLAKSKLFGGEIIMSNVGSIGKSFLCPNLDCPMTIGPNAILIRSNNNKFFLYYFQSEDFNKKLLSISSRATLKKFNKTNFKTLSIPVPPLPDQQRIVSYLDAEFAKIEALKANAEKQLQAAKDLFQAALKELLTPKEGWVEKKLGEVAKSMADGPFGSNLKAQHYTTKKEVRIVQLSNIGEFGWKEENVKYTSFEHLKTISRSEVHCGDIVIAKMMPAGRAIICPNNEAKYVLSSDAVKVELKDGYSPDFIMYSINSNWFNKQVLANVTGSGRIRTSLTKLRDCNLYIPDIETQKEVVEELNMAYMKTKALQTSYTETITLCNDLKQALLKKVFEEDG
ncbi:MAG: restriction endonuclease subunit S [Bacteroidales bacterium]|nr:restriction endonuclease subunit S [Bacteroidales bacterium]